MIVALIVVTVLIAAGVAMVVIGHSLPPGHSAACAARFREPPEAIWAALTDLEGSLRWRADLKRVERLPDREGRAAWIEEGRYGRITYVLEEERPPALRVVRIADPKLPFGGTWTYVLAPAEDGGTRLTVTEDGEVRPALFRFLSRYVFGYHGTLTAVLRALGRHFGETVGVDRVEPATRRT